MSLFVFYLIFGHRSINDMWQMFKFACMLVRQIGSHLISKGFWWLYSNQGSESAVCQLEQFFLRSPFSWFFSPV